MRWLLMIIIAAPSLAFAAPKTYKELAGIIIDIINAGIALVLVLAIVVYFAGIVVKMPSISKGGGAKDLGKQMAWGLVALFVMFSVWGILELVQRTLFSGEGSVGKSGSVRICDDFGRCTFGEDI